MRAHPGHAAGRRARCSAACARPLVGIAVRHARACASRASISRSRRWRRSSSSTGCSCASSGSPTTRRRARSRVAGLQVFGFPIDSADRASTCSCLAFVVRVRARSPRTWCAAHIGREWMAIRDMDVAAEVIGIRPMYAKLTAFAVSAPSSSASPARCGRFVYLGAWEPAAFSSTARSSCCSW